MTALMISRNLFFFQHKSSCFFLLPAVKAPAGLTWLSLAWHVKFQLSESLCAAIWAMTHHLMHITAPTGPYICKDHQVLCTNLPHIQTTSLPLSHSIPADSHYVAVRSSFLHSALCQSKPKSLYICTTWRLLSTWPHEKYYVNLYYFTLCSMKFTCNR